MMAVRARTLLTFDPLDWVMPCVSGSVHSRSLVHQGPCMCRSSHSFLAPCPTSPAPLHESSSHDCASFRFFLSRPDPPSNNPSPAIPPRTHNPLRSSSFSPFSGGLYSPPLESDLGIPIVGKLELKPEAFHARLGAVKTLVIAVPREGRDGSSDAGAGSSNEVSCVCASDCSCKLC